MKKFIQVCSLLSMSVVLVVASAFAQSSYGTEVEIPFAFNVGDRSHDAGNYIVKIQKLGPGSATLLIEDTKTDEVQSLVMNGSGDEPSAQLRLVFETVNGQKYLSKIRTSSISFVIAKTKAQKNAAKLRDTGPSSVNGGSDN